MCARINKCSEEETNGHGGGGGRREKVRNSPKVSAFQNCFSAETLGDNSENFIFPHEKSKKRSIFIPKPPDNALSSVAVSSNFTSEAGVGANIRLFFSLPCVCVWGCVCCVCPTDRECVFSLYCVHPTPVVKRGKRAPPARKSFHGATGAERRRGEAIKSRIPRGITFNKRWQSL